MTFFFFQHIEPYFPLLLYLLILVFSTVEIIFVFPILHLSHTPLYSVVISLLGSIISRGSVGTLSGQIIKIIRNI